MKLIRTEGHLAVIKYNKLIINGEAYSLEQLEAHDTEKEGEGAKKETNGEENVKKKGRTLTQRSPGSNEEVREKLLKIAKTGNPSKN